MNGRDVMIIIAFILLLLIAGKPIWIAIKGLLAAFSSLT
jgi:hypothetical protein